MNIKVGDLVNHKMPWGDSRLTLGLGIIIDRLPSVNGSPRWLIYWFKNKTTHSSDQSRFGSEAGTIEIISRKQEGIK